MRHVSKRRSGFTLIELLVVVSIIALLVSILMPALGQAREQGRRAKCSAHQHGWGNAVFNFSANYQELPRAYHYYADGWRSDPTGTFNSPDVVPPKGTLGTCLPYFISDVDEDMGDGAWRFYGTPWSSWIEHGLEPSQTCCPSARWLKRLVEGWVGTLEEDQIAFLDDSVQKPFSGQNRWFRRWTRTTYMYIGGVDLEDDWNTINKENPRVLQAKPMTRLNDRAPATRLLGGDMVYWDQNGGWTPAWMSEFRINHQDSAAENQASFQALLFGDGHVEGRQGREFDELDQTYADNWAYSHGPWVSSPWYFW